MRKIAVFLLFFYVNASYGAGYDAFVNNPEVKKQIEKVAPEIEKVLKSKEVKEEMKRLKPSVVRYKNFMKNETKRKTENTEKEGKSGRIKVLPDDEFIYVLVSSSISREILKSYVSQAAPFEDFIFAMRGVIGDVSKIKPTLKFIESVIRKDNNTAYDVEFDIDPFIFRESQVKKVPAFVLAKRSSSIDRRFKVEAVVYGDLSIGGAVKELYRMTCRRELEKLADMLHENVGVCGKGEKVSRAGNLYDIAEKDILDEIEKRIANLDKEKLISVLRRKAEEWRPENLAKIPPATENRTYSFIPVYTLKRDVPRVDRNGNVVGVLYPAGYTFNPLKYIHYMPTVVFFNGERAEEVEWVKRNVKKFGSDVKLCTTGGKAYKIAEYLKMPVYYATKDMIKKFHVEATISICRKKGESMVVEVVPVK